MTQRRASVIGLAAIILWTFLPMILSGIAYAIASACGCQLNEADTHSCIVFGRDIGGTLYALGLIGWLEIITFPTGLLAMIAFAVTRKW